jgi:hypothetical protein
MKRSWTAGLLFLATTACAAHAAMITDLETIGGREVAASADFEASSGKLTLTLDNLTPQTADASQLLTGILFTVSNGSTAIDSATAFTAVGSERTVFDDGTYTDSGPKNLSWELLAGPTMQIDFHPDAKDALIGPAFGESSANLGVYVANNSILGNAGHNPFGAEYATFTLTGDEFGPGSTIGNVQFLWGTSLSAGAVMPQLSLTAVPEPASISILACGAVVLLRRTRRA